MSPVERLPSNFTIAMHLLPMKSKAIETNSLLPQTNCDGPLLQSALSSLLPRYHSMVRT